MSCQTRHLRRTYRHAWHAMLLAGGVISLVPATAGYALLIAGGAANTNGSGIYGFSAIGVAGASSGIYLGNGWVLTARHSGATNLNLNGTNYSMVSSGTTTLTNPADLPYYAGNIADLIVYRVGAAGQAAPVVSPVSLASAPTAAGTAINVVGAGDWTSSLPISYWSVNQSTDPWTWTSTTAASANAAGYTYGSLTSGVVRYGTNVTDAAYYDSSNNYYSQVIVPGPAGSNTLTYCDTDSFFGGFSTTTGQPTGGTTYEAGIIAGDSGGGAFTASHLTGISLYEDNPLNNQPGGTYMFSPSALTATPPGTGITHNTDANYFADVGVYAAEILGLTGISEWTSYAGSSWTTPQAWGRYYDSAGYATVAAPNAAAATADFLSAAGAQHSVTVGVTVTVGAMNFDSATAYTLAGAGKIILDNSYNSAAFPAEINTFAGSHTISVALTLHSDLVVTDASGGGLTLSGNIGTDSTARALTKAGTGTLTLSGVNAYTGGTTVSAGKLIIGNLHALGTGGLTLAGGLTQVQSALTSATAALVVPGVSFAGGTLDLMNNRLLIKSSSDITSGIQAALTSGALTTSITSTAQSSTATTTIGYLSGAQYTQFTGLTTFGGAAVASNDIVARWTYAGDINLDGSVDLSDLRLMDAGYLGGFDGTYGHVATWLNGDVNHDGKVNAADFALAVAALNGTPLDQEMYTLYAGEFGAPFVAAYDAAVPEPASLTLLALGAGALLRRRPRA